MKQSSASMSRQKPEAAWAIVWRKTEQGLPRSPQGASKSHRGVKIRVETQGSTPIGHSGSHDLCGHRAIIRPDLTLFILFPSNSSRGAHRSSTSCRGKKAVQPSTDSPLREELTGPAHSSNSNQLQGGELQLPAHLTKETSSQFKLYKPPSSDATSFRRPSSPQRSCKAQQNHEGLSHTTSKTISQNWELHSKLFSPFPRTGN